MYQYECDSCSKVTEFSSGGYKIECTCGEWLKPINKGIYNYICSCCGNEFRSNTSTLSHCSECSSMDIVINYTDAGLTINTDLFREIQSNYQKSILYRYECSCGQHKNLFSQSMNGVMCYCGNFMKLRPNKELLSELKATRKKHKLSQETFAEKFGVSQSFYSEIELGRKPIPSTMVNWLNKNRGK